MRQSNLFTKPLHDAPKDEVSRNAQYLVQAGFVSKLMAGVYTYLPLGWRVLRNIQRIIRREMNSNGAVELFMPALHPVENYVKTGRSEIDVLFHLETTAGAKVVLGQSHEEVVVPLVQQYVRSYKDLPLYLYQIQVKFRNELRAKSGILRGREFMMKDLYSFHADEQDLDKFYERMRIAYQNIFSTAGIDEATHYTYASGGTFSKFSHEFQTVTDAGEDTIHVCSNCGMAVNDEIISQQPVCPACQGKTLQPMKSIEVGNIFKLKTRFSDSFHFTYTAADGSAKPVLMGCYGLGLGRLMGAVAELHSDERGLSWPATLAPFQVHLVRLGDGMAGTCDALYQALQDKGFEVLYDDREASAGAKFTDADLIGIPIRAVKSAKTGDKIELKFRNEKEVKLVTEDEFTSIVTSFYRERLR